MSHLSSRILKYLGYRRILLVFSCLFLLGAVDPGHFTITGIKGDVLLNVQDRLAELYARKPIDQASTKTLRLQIEKAMYPYGFFKPHMTISHNHTAHHLRIQINPGPQMRITSLTTRLIGPGASNPEIKQALRDIPTKKGQPLINRLYEEAKENLLSAAEHQGYLHASFEKSEIRIDRKRYTADITLILNTGPQYYFGQIRFDPTYVSPELLHRYVPFKPGQPYSTDPVLAFETNLSGSGYFKSVNVKPNTDSIRHVPINVHLQRINRINYSLGLGYGTDTGPRGRAGVHIIPVNRSGHKFNAIAQGSFKENTALAQYLIPGRNPITDNYSLTGRFSNLNYNSGYANSLLLSVAEQHIKSHHQRILSLNALDERFNYTEVPKTTKTLLFPKATLTWRKITDPLFSPSGYHVTLSGFAAGKALLSDINVAQATFDVKAALTLDIIRTRFFFHGIQGVTQINHIDDLPLSLAMLLGGADNMKAYSYNAIGPGKIMSYAGLEIQKETFEKWYLIGFVDSGDVYRPSLPAFQYDAGIGLMWVSPVGPIKIGVAQAVDNKFNRIPRQNPKLVINMGPDL